MDLEAFEGIKRKLNFSSMGKPALVGVMALVAIIIVIAVMRFYGVAGAQTFFIEKGESHSVSATQSAQAAGSGASATRSVQAAGSGADEQSGGSTQCVFVHVAGAVNNPGLLELDEGARIADAVKASGGFTEDAAPEAVNLARLLSDGEQIIVPTREQVDLPEIQPDPVSQPPARGKTAALAGTGLVNINTADAAELTTLPGVGDATAAKIVSNRQEEGNFKTIDDLKRVSGIGDKKFEALRDLICI